MALGDSLDVSLDVTGYPVPEFKWTFITTGNTLNETLSSSVLQTVTSLSMWMFSYRLKKTSIEEDEFGLYILHVKNRYGMFTSYVDVIQKGKS